MCKKGRPAVRMGDLMVSNNGNTPPAPLMQPGAPLPPELEATSSEVQQPQEQVIDTYRDVQEPGTHNLNVHREETR